MSTRATYRFTRPYMPHVTVYIHHDGYPEGAAAHLLGAIKHAGGHLTPEALIRSNPMAEITGSHEGHGDTDYRYTIDAEADRIEITKRRPGDPNVWSHVGYYRVDSMLRMAGEVVLQFRPGQWMTYEMAKEHATRRRIEAKDYAERFPSMLGNIFHHDKALKEAQDFEAQFLGHFPLRAREPQTGRVDA